MRNNIGHRTLCACLFALCTFLFAPSVPAQAQPTKVPQIGFLCTVPLAAYSGRIGAFRQGLRDLGYVEGKNIVIEYRSAEGKPDQLALK